MNLKYIFKIIDKDEWEKAKKGGIYLGSTMDLKDGFIHFSEENQIRDTLKKYYPKQKNLILLKVDTLKLKNLIWEQNSSGNFYPHLYSSLDVNFIKNEYLLMLDKNGIHKLPK